MKSGGFSKRKAVIVASLICLVFGSASWLTRTSPYDFEVVSVTQNPGENMKVKLRFTNGSDETMRIGLIQNGVENISYIPETERIPKYRPWRGIAFTGSIVYRIKAVKSGESLIIEDIDGIRKSGNAFYAIWQPPPSSDWLSKLRRKADQKIFGPYRIPIGRVKTRPAMFKHKVREWIIPLLKLYCVYCFSL